MCTTFFSYDFQFNTFLKSGLQENFTFNAALSLSMLFYLWSDHVHMRTIKRKFCDHCARLCSNSSPLISCALLYLFIIFFSFLRHDDNTSLFQFLSDAQRVRLSFHIHSRSSLSRCLLRRKKVSVLKNFN